jgi:hypothetical protein
MFNLFRKKYPIDGYYLEKIVQAYRSSMGTGTETYYVIRNIVDDSISFNFDNLIPLDKTTGRPVDVYGSTVGVDYYFLSDTTRKYMEEFTNNKYLLKLNENIEIKKDKLTKVDISMDDMRDIKLNSILYGY